MGHPDPRKPGEPFTTKTPNPRSPPAMLDTSFRLDGGPLGRGSPRAGSGWARAVSRTLATGIHALRSLVGNLATPSWLRSVSQRRSTGTGPPLANPYSDSARVAAIEAPRREPVGLRAVGLFPLPIPANRSPPQRPIRGHYQPPSGTSTTGLRAVWLFPRPIPANRSPPSPRSPPRHGEPAGRPRQGRILRGYLALRGTG